MDDKITIYKNKDSAYEMQEKNHINQELTLKKEVEYDELLSAAGEFGRYQIYLTFLTCPFYIFGVFAYFSQLFLTEPSPNHWCWVPELENLTDIERRTLAIPLDPDGQFGYSKCEMYVVNWSEVLRLGLKPNQSWITQSCQYGWEFNKSEIPYPTITSEMGWVCDKDSYQATAQAMFFVGSVVGGFIMGWLADRFGRIPAIVLSNIIGCVAGIVSVFAKSFVQFTICRFLMGISYDSCMIIMYLLVLEFVAPKYRSIMANLPFGVFYSVGATTLPWIAIACGHWKTISLVTSIPMAVSLLAPLVVPESPRWLLVKGRVEEATEKIITICRVNNKEVPTKLLDEFKVSAFEKGKEDSKNPIDMCRRPLLRKIFICLCVEYMCCMTVFDALVRCLGGLQFDFFVSFTLVSLTECPSLLIVSFILDLTGRKWMSVFCLVICAVFSFLIAFFNGGWPTIFCAVAARFAVNMSANIAMQWGAEMLPTPVRGSSVAFIHICGYVSSILSPYIIYLEKYVSWLPLIVVGLIALLGAISALALPETVGQDLPQSFEDTEKFITNQKMFNIPCLQRNREKDYKGKVNSSFQMS